MAHDLLTRESPEITRFFQDIGHITELLKSEPDRYRPVLNGDRYITEAELSELLLHNWHRKIKLSVHCE